MLENEEKNNSVVPDTEESMRFSSSVWDNPVSHNTSVEWLNDVENISSSDQTTKENWLTGKLQLQMDCKAIGVRILHHPEKELQVNYTTVLLSSNTRMVY